jgi:hypothetical protein
MTLLVHREARIPRGQRHVTGIGRPEYPEGNGTSPAGGPEYPEGNGTPPEGGPEYPEGNGTTSHCTARGPMTGGVGVRVAAAARPNAPIPGAARICCTRSAMLIPVGAA